MLIEKAWCMHSMFVKKALKAEIDWCHNYIFGQSSYMYCKDKAV